MGVFVTTFGTGVVEDAKIAKAVEKLFDFRPAAIIETLDLLRPIYLPTAAYGHFGRSEDSFTWERTDRAAELRDAVSPKAAPSARAEANGKKNGNGASNGHGKKPKNKKKNKKKKAKAEALIATAEA